jgi:CheY-like chemotaxis protein
MKWGRTVTKLVLVIDDNELLFRLYRSLLGPLPCKLAHAGSGQEALNFIRQEKPDLVILNHRPRGDAGASVELAAQIRAAQGLAQVPIVATTSLPGDVDDKLARLAGYAAVVVKPIQKSAFIELMQRLLEPEPALETLSVA